MTRGFNESRREFRVTTGANNKKLSATCKNCGKTWKAPNATRCSEHLKKCPKLPDNLRRVYAIATATTEELRDEIEDPPAQNSESVDGARGGPGPGPSSQGAIARPPLRSSSSSSDVGQGDGPRPPKRQRSAANFVDSISKEEKDRIDEALARAVNAKGLPLSIFEGEHFAAALKLMRPAYEKPPSRAKLSNSLLEKEYGLINAINREKIKSSDCKALMLDGCGNVNRENIVNFIITTPDPVFYTYVVPDDSRETCDFVARQVRKILVAENPIIFFLIMTDNASVMRAMWKVIEEEFPHITGAGCAAHCFNLLFQDLVSMPALDRVLGVAKRVVKSIRNSYKNLNTFREKQEEKYGNNAIQLKLQPRTRWAYSVIMLNSLMKNKAAVQETVVNEDLDIDAHVRAWALDNGKFWERVKLALKMLKPQHASITIVESNRTLLPDVFFLQKKYTESIVSNLRNLRFKKRSRVQVREILADREEFTIKVIHKATFLLDPRYRNDENMLSPNDIVDSIGHFGTLCNTLNLVKGSVIASLGEYRTRTGFFARAGVWDAALKMAPSVWWRGVCSGEALAPIAWRLLSLPPTSAECERDWSERNFIHSKSRNRLKNERVQKLVVCKKGLKTKKAKTTTSPFFTVDDIESYFEKYLEPTERNQESDSSSSEEDGESDEDEGADREAGLDSDWSDRDNTSADDEEEDDGDGSGATARNISTPPVSPIPPRASRTPAAAETPNPNPAATVRRSTRRR